MASSFSPITSTYFATLFVATIFAQPPGPQFAVASIKPNKSRSVMMGVRQLSRGTLITENTPLRFLVAVAYKRREGWFEVEGGPAWLDSDGYDIVAKAEGDLSNEQMLPMLQNLLRDRFHLQMRRETRNLSVYELVAARSGLKLNNVETADCWNNGSGAPAPPPKSGKTLILPCGSAVAGLSSHGMQIRGGRTSMQRFALALSSVLGRTVIDKTGFHGTFDVDVEFAPDDALAAIPARGLPGSIPNPPAPGESAPSIFTAVEERLGLKLNSARGPVPVFIVEHVERPTPN